MLFSWTSKCLAWTGLSESCFCVCANTGSNGEADEWLACSAVRIIRNHENAAVRDIKIIALTANAVSGDEERFLGMGMDVYLSKPVRAAKLEEAILACLKGL